MFLHFSNFHMHSPTAASMRIWNLNLEVNSPSTERKHHSVHLKELYCGMLRHSCSKDKSWPLPWSPVHKLGKKKRWENTLKRLYPAKHSKDVSEHLKEQAAFKREFSFTELGIHTKGESASWYSLPPPEVLLYQLVALCLPMTSNWKPNNQEKIQNLPPDGSRKAVEVHLHFISASSTMIQTYLLTKKIPTVELLQMCYILP